MKLWKLIDMQRWQIIIIIFGIILIIFLTFNIIVKENESLIGMKVIQGFPVGEKIEVEIMSINYMINKKFLMKVEINGEQVGIIYFDEHGKIQLEGDREKFEHALCKAFKITEKEWRK